MEARTALLVALGSAVTLPYLTVALVRGGGGSLALVGALFVAVLFLVVWSDGNGGDDHPDDVQADEPNDEGVR